MLKLIEREGFKVREQFADPDLVVVRDIYHNDAYRLGLLDVERVASWRVVVDVGAHIGAFARKVHELNPDAVIVCVEADELNMPALRENAPFAHIVHGACSYDPRPLTFWSSVAKPNCSNTGGGRLVPAFAEMNASDELLYYRRAAPPVLTLEALRDKVSDVVPGFDIDLLKLDCEGSEFSILANCELDRVEFIVGEYHGEHQWNLLREWRMPSWDYGHMSRSGDLGNFHLRNPASAYGAEGGE